MLTKPTSIFGIHSVSPYSRESGEFYGTLKVLENSSLSITGEQISLLGGSNKYDWSSEVGSITAELALSFSEYPAFVFELFGGASPVENSAETNGSITTAANKKGTSMIAATGLASIGIKTGQEANLKFGRYVVKAISTDEVEVYFSSDADMGRGTNGEYQNDRLKVTESSLTISTGASVDVPNFGLELVGGGSATAFTVGDTATFSVRPPNDGSMDITVGSSVNQNFEEFGAILMANKQGNGEMFEIDALRCKASSLPIGLTRNAYSPSEVTAKLLYDSEQDGVYKVRHIKPKTVN